MQVTKKYEILSVVLIFLAEILLFLGHRNASTIVHSLNILVIMAAATLKKDMRLLQTLSLVSIFRIINISLPIYFSFTIYWMASLYGLMLLPIFLIAKEQNISIKDMGITMKWSYLWPAAIPLGLGLALIENHFLNPEALIPGITAGEILKLGLVMFLFIGLVEEIIFRSFLQQRLEEKIGTTGGLMLASLIFGFMHSGYSNPYEVLFAIFAGLLIGFCFQRTRSLPFVIIVHGINNTILFGVLPFL
ncbi:MAG TPA: CPBP family intramembrane glutamic endopeptidase [Candidatus Methanoperedens sp.]